MIKLKVRIAFFEEALGMLNANKDLYDKFIASRSPDAATREEEIAALGTDIYKKSMTTIFPKLEDGTPYIYDYQIKGMFKDYTSALRRIKGTESSKIKAFKKEIDGLIMPSPRRIPVVVNGELGECQRPLRGSTPQGETVALTSSESIPAGSYFEMTITMLKDDYLPWIKEMLDFGRVRGSFQWRNAGKGTFLWKELSCIKEETVITDITDKEHDGRMQVALDALNA